MRQAWWRKITAGSRWQSLSVQPGHICGYRRRDGGCKRTVFVYPVPIRPAAAGALQWKATGGCGNLVPDTARRGRCGCRPSIRLCCASLPGWGNNLNQIARLTAPVVRRLTVQVVAALMAIDAELERLRMPCWVQRGQTMIVKFHPRGRGGAGPVIIWGKDRQRGWGHRPGAGGGPGAYRCLRLTPAHRGVSLSFAEQDCTPGQRKADGELERVLMPGLDKDQSTACCGLNTGQGR